MKKPLKIAIGSASDRGVKQINQDFIGHLLPPEPQLSSKGIAIAMADGISSSQVSQQASQAAITGFLEDYYCTSELWSVKNSAQKVIKSINSWLYAQTQNSQYRYDKDKGYITTFSALVLKSNTAHVFHVGDTRIYRISQNAMQCLTKDHRRVVSSDVSYLTRALGIEPMLALDYRHCELEVGDMFMLATDGVYQFIAERDILSLIDEHADLTAVANKIVERALDAGSDDNLSVQLARIEQLPNYQLDEIQQQISHLPLPPKLQIRMEFDGYKILRDIYISSRSHVFLALDKASNKTVVIKTPSTEMANDKGYLESFMLEEWVARRVNSSHVAKVFAPERKRNFLYLVMEYIEGVSLHQWMIDNPKPTLKQVRDILSQVAKGLQAFHRQEMLHQDIRPHNIMIDSTNTVKIIDFGSVYIAGVTDVATEQAVRGTMRYAAPEYFLGQPGRQSADIYSLAVIGYQMLSGEFPYSNNLVQARSLSAQRKFHYKSLIDDDSELPLWLDDAFARALEVEPLKRYQELSEFIHDIHQPSSSFVARNRKPLMARNPLLFWQLTSLVLLLIVIAQAISD